MDTMDKAHHFTNDVVRNDLEIEEAAFKIVVEAHPSWTKEKFHRLVEKKEMQVLAHNLNRKRRPPRMARAYVRFQGIRNAFGSILGFDKPFPYAHPDPHKPPWSLAYLEYWYEQTHKGEPASEEVEVPRTVTGGALDSPRMSKALMMYLWNTVTKDQELEQGLGPFEIILPAARDLTKIFGDLRPEALKSYLESVARFLGGLSITLTLQVGDALRPTTLSMAVLRCEMAHSEKFLTDLAYAWNVLCRFGSSATVTDYDLLKFVREYWQSVYDEIDRGVSREPPQHIYFYNWLKGSWAGAPDSAGDRERQVRPIREAMLKDKRKKTMLAAQEREVNRLADEVWEKVAEGEASFDEKAKKLTAFVDDGHPGVDMPLRTVRAFAVEALDSKLAAQLVREMVAQGNEDRVEVFVKEGDGRLPSLDNPSARLAIADKALASWTSAAIAQVKKNSERCSVVLKQIQAEMERDGR